MAFGTCEICLAMGILVRKFVKYNGDGRMGQIDNFRKEYNDYLICNNLSCLEDYSDVFEEVSEEEYNKYIELEKIL